MRARDTVRLFDLLERSQALEQRAAAVYRQFAATQLRDLELAALWTRLAADEDDHAQSIAAARHALPASERDLVAVEGCDVAFDEVAERLQRAEALGADATVDRQLAAALDLELSALEALRMLALHASHQVDSAAPDPAHLYRLGNMAMQRSSDGHVRLAAALLFARERLAASSAARS